MTAAPFDAARRADAVALIRALCAAAGSEDAVLDALERHAQAVGKDEAVRTIAAALIVTFGTCMTSAVSLDARTPTPITIPDTEGAPTP